MTRRERGILAFVAFAVVGMPARTANTESTTGDSLRREYRGVRQGGTEAPCGAPDALAAKRHEAVRRGMEHLKILCERKENGAVLGTNALSIFLEMGETSADPDLRRDALREARRVAKRLENRLLAPGGLDDRGNLTEALELLPDTNLLHLSKQNLLAAVRNRIAGSDPDDLYFGSRIKPSRLAELSEDDLFDLLITAYTVERACVAFPELSRPAFGLAELLKFIFEKKLTGFLSDTSEDRQIFQDHAYLATHVAFVLNDYGRLRLSRAELGPILPWLLNQFEPVFAARDEELVAEIVDVLRSLGAADTDSMVCRGSTFLLERQRPDGSWGDWKKEEDFTTPSTRRGRPFTRSATGRSSPERPLKSAFGRSSTSFPPPRLRASADPATLAARWTRSSSKVRRGSRAP